MTDQFDQDQPEAENPLDASEESFTPPDLAADELAVDIALPPVDHVTAEVEADQGPLRAADADADADLARPARATQYRAQRRLQISMALPGLLLIAFGFLLLWQALAPQDQILPPLALPGIAVGALGLGMIARFVLNGRRERGLFLVALLILFFAALFAFIATGAIFVEQLFPLSLIAIGLAVGMTFVFERSHERGLLLPALALMAAGGVALPFTLGILTFDLTSLVTTFWPLLLLVLAILLLPLAIRPGTREYRD